MRFQQFQLYIQLASSCSCGNICPAICKAMVLRMMSLQKAAYLASYVHREVVLQPEATIVPALVVLQVARVLQDLCYMFLCHFSGGAADKFEPAHLSIWMQTDRHTDRQTDRQTDGQTDRQTDGWTD